MSVLGICDYCGKHRLVSRLDDRAYVACAPCATEIHCYQAVTDEDALGLDSDAGPRRRRRRRNADVADKRRKWLNRLGRAIDHAGAGRLTVVALRETGGALRPGEDALSPADAPAWAIAAAEHLDADEIAALL